uniref:Spt5 C-terminal domain-containing protein n=1 Tax=Cuerna arida TaxID=1464854 RepID=A0A1B6GUV3_9HEMI
MSPRISSPMHPSGGGGGGAGRGRGRGGGNVRRDRDLIGQIIKITRGPYKGNVGMVKDATESTARVELHSSCQTISVDRSHIATVGMPNKDGSISSYNRTPGYGGAATPMYGRDGSKTPMHGSQTPLYEAGSRTPHYGSMTPSHDGSRTPGAWDPSITNTPARSDADNYSLDEFGAHPSNGPYTPQTPGGMYGSDQSYSPYQGSPSPTGYHSGSSAYVPTPSPSSAVNVGAYGTPSPMSYSPLTPGGAPSPYNSHSTGMDPMMQDWHTTDIEVRVRESHDDSDLVGQVGTIRSISGGMCSVFLPDEDRTVSISCEQLEPVIPAWPNPVKVILGEDKERTGDLLSIDNQEGVVKLDGDEVKMLQLRYLCKYNRPGQD